MPAGNEVFRHRHDRPRSPAVASVNYLSHLTDEASERFGASRAACN